MAKLTAEMRLSLAALRQDAQRAAKTIQEVLDKEFRSAGGGSMAGILTAPPSFRGPVTKGGLPYYTGPVPPRVPPPPPPNFGMAGLGALAGLFSPWIGGATIARSGIFNTGIGKTISNLFGGGFVGNFTAAYTALQVSTRVLKFAFDELKEAVIRTSKLYQESMSINRPIGRMFQIQAAFAAIGLGPDAAKRYAKSGPAGLNAEEMMRLTNMSDSFKKNFDDSAMDAKIISLSAQQTQQAFEEATMFIRELKTAFVVIAATLTPVLKSLERSSLRFEILKFAIKKMLDKLPDPNDKYADLAGGKGMFNWNIFRQTSLERMGFTIGGNGTNALLAQANRHLSVIANAVTGRSNGFIGPMPTNLP